MELVFLKQAAEELQLIDDPLYTRIVKKTQMLLRFPHLGAEMYDAFLGFRGLLAEPYRIIYRMIEGKRIEIAFLFHMKRKPGSRD